MYVWQVVPQVNEQVQDDAAEPEGKEWIFSLSAENKAAFDGIWAKVNSRFAPLCTDSLSAAAVCDPSSQGSGSASCFARYGERAVQDCQASGILQELRCRSEPNHLANAGAAAGHRQHPLSSSGVWQFQFADDELHRGELMPKDGDEGFDARIAECLEDSQTPAEGEQNVAK